MEYRSAQRRDDLLGNSSAAKCERREEKMETVLKDGTCCLEKKALITYDATVPVD